MDELIERLRRLPKQPLTWQGGIFAWPHFVREESGPPFRPLFPLWADLESGAIHTDAMLAPDQDLLRAALEALGGFVEKLLDNRACPQRLEVNAPELAEYLRRRLDGAGIEVRLSSQLPVLEAAVAEMASMFDAQSDGPPSLLDSRGVTVERVRAFAAAAAAFHRASPWRHLSDTDLIQIESPKPPRGMACLVVLGAGRNTYGLGLYPSRAAYDRFLRAGHEGYFGADVTAGLCQVTFDPLDELPIVDAALWAEHQLPVAGDRAYPLAMKHRRDGEIARPTKQELTFLEGVLQALATTSEEEIDSGRWRKEITTFDGQAAMTLAIPDLLEPPSPQAWIQRGFAPDRRAHERVFADMHRYLEEHPPTGDDGLETINRLFAGRSLDDPLTQPRSSAERAQDLCYQAFDAHGRRRVQLARQALELDPDCTDAHVILAEQAGAIEDELNHYRRGVQAAERTLGSAYFTENAGHFWGLTATRPYMRARFGLAESLAASGCVDEAIDHYQELRRLNPNDNQGVRYVLLPKLLTAGRDVEAARLLKKYVEESANWAYACALLAFRLSGRSTAVGRELRAALRVNPHVPELLCSEAPIPQPPHYAPGSFEEACVAAEELRPAFQATSGAIDWIFNAQQRRAEDLDRVRREHRRQERTKQKKRKRR
jgi:tetratricopeptide (TPR) repeat protein